MTEKKRCCSGDEKGKKTSCCEKIKAAMSDGCESGRGGVKCPCSRGAKVACMSVVLAGIGFLTYRKMRAQA